MRLEAARQFHTHRFRAAQPELACHPYPCSLCPPDPCGERADCASCCSVRIASQYEPTGARVMLLYHNLVTYASTHIVESLYALFGDERADRLVVFSVLAVSSRCYMVKHDYCPFGKLESRSSDFRELF